MKVMAESDMGNKKIIFTVSTYYPKKDGVQFVTEYLAEGLAARNYDVTVITEKPDGTPCEQWHKGVHIVRFPIYTRYAFHYGDLENYKKHVIRLSKDADVLINVCMQCAATDTILPVLKKIACRKILYMHGMHRFGWRKEDFSSVNRFTHKIWNNFIWGFRYRSQAGNIKKYDKIIQIHRFDGAYDFIKKKYDRDSIVIENAAEEAFFKETEERQFCLGKRYCVCVANYLEIKNQIFSMRAFFYSPEMKDFALIYIGSEKNSYYEKMCLEKKKLEQKYGKRDVQFLTGVPRKDIYDYVRGACICLLSSISEVYPVSLIESMAAGVPFIAADAGIARYLPGGVIVYSEREMSYWMSQLAQNKGCRDFLGKSGREYARNHCNVSGKIDQLEKIIEELESDG